jgi:hypothetical protein
MAQANGYITTMPRDRCVVCRHKDRDAIDRDLIQKRRTQSDIARQLDVDRSTVSRHYRYDVLPALASAMISAPGDVSIGTMIAAFDELYGSNQQIREMAIAREDLRSAKDVNAEQRKLLELLLKHGEKIGAGSVTDAIGIDGERWRELERETATKYAGIARQDRFKFARAITTLGDIPDDVREKITEIFLKGQLSKEELEALDVELAEIFGDEWPDSEGGDDQEGTS